LLLADQHDVGVLHGDIHHGNILDFGPRGWLTIDPKGLIGERDFDYANLFCNPDLAHPAPSVALKRLNGEMINLPTRAKDRPDRDRLALRFGRFKPAA